jgi:hypothetical protein
MNRNLVALALAGLVATCTFTALATDETSGSVAPPTALPGVNQGHSSGSNEEKADKKGEEAAGSNSGADSQATEKDASTSSGSKSVEKAPKQ